MINQQSANFDNELKNLISFSNSSTSENIRTICPACSRQRSTETNRRERVLSTKIDSGGAYVYNCHHCEITGVIWPDARSNGERPSWPREEQPNLPASDFLAQITGELSTAGLSFMEGRGISKKTCDRLGLFSASRWFARSKVEAEAVAFPYVDIDGKGVAVKYRNTRAKDFTQDGSSNIFWQIDKLSPEAPPTQVIIVEGEIDLCSMVEAGVENVLSIPNGAPGKIKNGRVDPKDDKKFSYVWEAEGVLEKVEKIIIFADQDAPGEALAEELARRFGKVRCWKARVPDGCKDANHVLIRKGSQAVRDCVEKADPWPVSGLHSASTYFERVKDLWSKGHGRGLSTGMACLDELFTIQGGQVTVVTGIPSHGKSEIVDQITANLAENEGWRFALCSFENDPPDHIVKLAEKKTGRPFYQGMTARMSAKTRDAALDWVHDHYVFIEQSSGDPTTITSILERAAVAVRRYGIRGLIIDPYNFIDMSEFKEQEYKNIATMLVALRAFAKLYDVHIWFVAHPQKLRRGQDGAVPVAGGYDISGSPAWYNHCDIGFTILRTPENEVQVHTWKVRHKWIGRQGQCVLRYEPASGRYAGPIEVPDWDKVQSDLESQFVPHWNKD